MKKVIKGKLYDTEKAKEVGVWGNGLGWSDFKRCSETLYIKKTGEYFLYGEGGPMSRWSVSNGDNTWSGGNGIIPMTYEEAAEWAEEHLTADEYASQFEIVPEDGDKVQMKFYLSASTATAIRQAARVAGKQPSEFVDEILSDALQ